MACQLHLHGMESDSIKTPRADGSKIMSLDAVQRLARAFEHTSIGMALQDPSGNWLEVNPAFCDLLGYARSDLIGLSFLELTHSDDVERSLQQLKRLKRGELNNFRFDKRYIHSKGHEVWVRLDVSLVRDEQDQPDFIITQAQDITVQRQIRNALADSEARLEAIIRSMGEGVMVFDLDGQLVMSNDRAAEMFGIPVDEMVESSKLDERWHASHPDGRRVAIEEYPAIITLSTGQPQREVVFCIKKKDGSDVWVEINTEPVRLETNGSMIAVVASISDITEKRRTQLALSDSKERLSLALEGARLGMWDWHLENDDFILNQIATDILGYGPTEFKHKLPNIQALFHADDRKHILRSMSHHLKGESSQFNIDARLYDKHGGHVWVNMRGRISDLDASGTPVRVSGMLVDISDRKRLEDRLVELATTDALTGLYNRGYGRQLLNRELARAERSGQSLSFILMDVDYFKSINDQFGHAVGDQMLAEISETLKNRIRDVDMASRWGGEEFVIILPDTPLTGAKKVAQSLQAGIRSLAKPDGNHLSMSMGVTEYRTSESVAKLLKRADRLMYRAKNTGRDRIEVRD